MNSIKIVGIKAIFSDIEKVKIEKRKYINYMIRQGLGYMPIQLMSAMANEAIEFFNSEKVEEIPIHESFVSTDRTNTEINKHINLFVKNMKEAGISDEVIDYMEKVSRDTLQVLIERKIIPQNNV